MRSQIAKILVAVDRLLEHDEDDLGAIDVLRGLRRPISLDPLLVTFDISYNRCSLPIDGNAGENDEEKWVKAQLADGNEAAWFRATVTATYTADSRIFEGADSIGGCSYESFESFEEDDLYQDLQEGAVEAMLAEIEACGYVANRSKRVERVLTP